MSTIKPAYIIHNNAKVHTNYLYDKTVLPPTASLNSCFKL